MKNFLARNGKQSATAPADEVTTNGAIAPESIEEEAPASANKLVRTDAFDQPVILQQTSIWSRGIVWGIVGVATFVIGWAALARIEQAVPATGKLEPTERVQEIQAPVGGVIEEILVEDGQRVQQGDVLIRFDPRATQAQLESLRQVRQSLEQENRFYRSQLLGIEPSAEDAVRLDLPSGVLQLTANRSTLLAENALYRAQLSGGGTGGLSADQLARLRVGLTESGSRASAAQLEISQLREQLRQTDTQLNAAEQTLAINEGIQEDLRPLVEEGGLARVQFLRQEQEVLTGRAEVERLRQEQQRIQFAIAQAQQQLQNTLAVTDNDLLNRIAENDKRIAEIDSQLNKAIVENEKQMAELDSQLAQAELTLQYQELRAPIDGIVFDLQAQGPGFVATTSEPILKIVPSEGLVAQVFVTNQDIGFVEEGMPVDVRIDSFPFSEFGDLSGTLTNIGSDALPPDEVYPFYRFPATVELEQSFIEVNNREIPLQSGMSVTVNIITRDRTVLSIFTDMFTGKVDSLRTVR